MSEKSAEKLYASFLEASSAAQWRRIGLKKRAGVATPLFSLYSSKSIGIGEIPDLKLLVQWCKEAGLSILQLLPMNDTGTNFRPYDAQSTFALEPIYLSLEEITGIRTDDFRDAIAELRRRFPPNPERADYSVKGPKLGLLWKMFESREWGAVGSFSEFKKKNVFWLKDYALFKVLKEKNGEKGWEEWDEPARRKDPAVLEEFEKENKKAVEFQIWVQWQLFEQFKNVKADAGSSGVLLFGDLPFLVSRDSADVWAHQDYFKLDLSSGAPPDSYSANGQNWGMPPYNWHHIERDGFRYLIERLKVAENFYDLFRIDHAVGMFRIWTISRSEPPETGGLNGRFDPADEHLWDAHGRKILLTMLQNTSMLPCAEDLGVVPKCCTGLLKEWAVPGMEIQRWVKDWGKTNEYISPSRYRKNSIASISIHDSTSLRAWWEFEAGTVDEAVFKRKCESRGKNFEHVKRELFDPEKSRYGRLRWKREISDVGKMLWFLQMPYDQARDFVEIYEGTCDEREKFWKFLKLEGEPAEEPTPEFVEKMLEKCGASVSVFSIQLLQDWLALGLPDTGDVWKYRINFPGTTSPENWSLVIPIPLEELLKSPLTQKIREINRRTGRI